MHKHFTVAVDADGIERAANHVIPHAGQILYPATTDEHDRVLLKVVTFTRDIGRYFKAVRKAHTGNLAKS